MYGQKIDFPSIFDTEVNSELQFDTMFGAEEDDNLMGVVLGEDAATGDNLPDNDDLGPDNDSKDNKPTIDSSQTVDQGIECDKYGVQDSESGDATKKVDPENIDDDKATDKFDEAFAELLDELSVNEADSNLPEDDDLGPNNDANKPSAKDSSDYDSELKGDRGVSDAGTANVDPEKIDDASEGVSLEAMLASLEEESNLPEDDDLGPDNDSKDNKPTIDSSQTTPGGKDIACDKFGVQDSECGDATKKVDPEKIDDASENVSLEAMIASLEEGESNLPEDDELGPDNDANKPSAKDSSDYDSALSGERGVSDSGKANVDPEKIDDASEGVSLEAMLASLEEGDTDLEDTIPELERPDKADLDETEPELDGFDDSNLGNAVTGQDDDTDTFDEAFDSLLKEIDEDLKDDEGEVDNGDPEVASGEIETPDFTQPEEDVEDDTEADTSDDSEDDDTDLIAGDTSIDSDDEDEDDEIEDECNGAKAVEKESSSDAEENAEAKAEADEDSSSDTPDDSVDEAFDALLAELDAEAVSEAKKLDSDDEDVEDAIIDQVDDGPEPTAAEIDALDTDGDEDLIDMVAGN